MSGATEEPEGCPATASRPARMPILMTRKLSRLALRLAKREATPGEKDAKRLAGPTSRLAI